MKKSDLKRLIKPIVKECINEALIEQGLLSNIISEVVRGLGPVPTTQSIQENKDMIQQQKKLEEERLLAMEEQQRALKEQKRKLLDAAGFDIDVFEGVAPLSKGGSPSPDASSTYGALSGVDPNDAGVDITGIMAVANRDWKSMI
jgi:hypothetical protein